MRSKPQPFALGGLCIYLQALDCEDDAHVRDLDLGRMINVVAAGSLLTATGCDIYHKAARKTCQALRECAPNAFDSQFSSMGDCVDTFEEYLTSVEESYGRECAKAFARFDICLAKAQKKTCSAMLTSEECAKEYSLYFDACYY